MESRHAGYDTKNTGPVTPSSAGDALHPNSIGGGVYILKRAYNKTVGKLAAVSVALEALSVYMLYLLNSVYGKLYQGIQDYNTPVIWHSIATFAGIAMVLVVVNGYLGWFLNKLAFEMRAALTYSTHGKPPEGVELLPQRIQEDFRLYGELQVEVTAAIFKAGLKLPVFIAVIVSITKWYIGLAIVAAVVIGTVLTKLAGRRQVELKVVQESNEAEYRIELQHSIKHGKGYTATTAWIKIINQFALINKEVKKLSFLQSGLGQAFVLLPFIVLMPLYIAKAIPLGPFFQSVNALGKVIDSLTILIDNRQLLVQLDAVKVRLKWLENVK